VGGMCQCVMSLVKLANCEMPDFDECGTGCGECASAGGKCCGAGCQEAGGIAREMGQLAREFDTSDVADCCPRTCCQLPEVRPGVL
jgi:hypothetical protein